MFDQALGLILEFEGEYVNDSNDPGGETKYGISKRAYPHLDIKEISKKDAAEIYKTNYWDSLRCDLLPPALALIIFDCGVNQGPAIAAKFLQKAVGAKVDGIIGPATLKAASECDPMGALESVSVYRHRRYTENPHWQYYGKGWSSRLLKVSILSAFYVLNGSAKDGDGPTDGP